MDDETKPARPFVSALAEEYTPKPLLPMAVVGYQINNWRGCVVLCVDHADTFKPNPKAEWFDASDWFVYCDQCMEAEPAVKPYGYEDGPWERMLNQYKGGQTEEDCECQPLGFIGSCPHKDFPALAGDGDGRKGGDYGD